MARETTIYLPDGSQRRVKVVNVRQILAQGLYLPQEPANPIPGKIGSDGQWVPAKRRGRPPKKKVEPDPPAPVDGEGEG